MSHSPFLMPYLQGLGVLNFQVIFCFGILHYGSYPFFIHFLFLRKLSYDFASILWKNYKLSYYFLSPKKTILNGFPVSNRAVNP